MTKLTYAEAVKRVSNSIEKIYVRRWGGKLASIEFNLDQEALAVLRRAGKVMGAVEGTKIFPGRKEIPSCFHYGEDELSILRAALAYKETK